MEAAGRWQADRIGYDPGVVSVLPISWQESLWRSAFLPKAASDAAWNSEDSAAAIRGNDLDFRIAYDSRDDEDGQAVPVL